MLPFLVAGGVIAGLGKLIYDAVKDDGSSSSSSGGGTSDEAVKKAREQARNEQRRRLSAELLAATSADVSAILDAHPGVVTGKAKTPASPANVISSAAIRLAVGFPFPTGGAESSRNSDGHQAGGAGDGLSLSMSNLQDLVSMGSKKSGFEGLKKLTSGLAYAEAYRKDGKWIERMSRKRDMLRALAEEL
ncbi:hypothetical protein [Achromobacter arsenitoxydans]|uniref:Uncharacterized protein n=1 Tax=Achromobacter arsenitoxydans SY8 TaxID=477184 RepID=H0FCC3_9BURK|nr:hypothetical protein [Achromobacter arsenitoxydans]EHK64092.1 hypothetical protein KYC_22161 [Achromobacter arsenitoxydans SY8]